MKQRQGKGEKKDREDACMGKEKDVHTVYSQKNERMTGEVMKNHIKKQKSKASRKCGHEFGEKSSFISFWSFGFSAYFPRF